MNIVKFQGKDNDIAKHRKEKSFHSSYIGLNADLKEVITIRFYVRPTMTYCVLWLKFAGCIFSGSAVAKGWGYDRKVESCAFALVKCGIVFDGERNLGDMHVILESLTKFFKIKKWVHAHA